MKPETVCDPVDGLIVKRPHYFHDLMEAIDINADMKTVKYNNFYSDRVVDKVCMLIYIRNVGLYFTISCSRLWRRMKNNDLFNMIFCYRRLPMPRDVSSH